MSTVTLTVELPELTLRSPSRTDILGVGVSVINMDDAIRQCDELIRSNGQGYVCATDVHSVTEALSDPTFRQILNGSLMTAPDGMPLVWIGRLRGNTRMRRVYGPDFLLEMCRFSVQRGYRHFFYGGKPGIADQLSARLTALFPGLKRRGNSYAALSAPHRRRGTTAHCARRTDETRCVLGWAGIS